MTRKHVPDLLRRHIETANRKHRQGRLGDAEADYMNALSMAPGHPDDPLSAGSAKTPDRRRRGCDRIAHTFGKSASW